MVASDLLVASLVNSERTNTLIKGTKLRATIMIDYLIAPEDYHAAAAIKDEIFKLLHDYSKDHDNIVMMDKETEGGSVTRKKAVQFMIKDRRGKRQPDIEKIKFRSL